MKELTGKRKQVGDSFVAKRPYQDEVDGPESELGTIASDAGENEHRPTKTQRRKKSTPGQVPINGQLKLLASTRWSSLSSLQMKDLLAEITPRSNLERGSPLAKQASQLQDVILSLPDVEPMTATEAKEALWRDSGIRIPFPGPVPDEATKYRFEFRRPERVEISEDITSTYTVDLSVTLPNSIFEDKDYLNYRYFHKRAYYIAQLAAGIQKAAKEDFKLSFDYEDGVFLRPSVLLERSVSDAGSLAARFRLRVSCYLTQEFPATKIGPEKCCVRLEGNSQPTPFYNASLQAESFTKLTSDLLEETSHRSDGFRDVHHLGWHWLRIRGFGSNICKGGFGSSEWTYICATLLNAGLGAGKPALSSRYDGLQLFKAMLQFLVMRDLIKEPFSQGMKSELKSLDVPYFFDSTRKLNLLFKMSSWSYQLLRDEARATLDAFNARSTNHFESVLTYNLEKTLYRYDEVFLLNGWSSGRDYLRHGESFSLRLLHKTVETALGNRAKRINLMVDPLPLWKLEESCPYETHCSTIRIGLVLDPQHTTRLVDHGPSAEDGDAASEFRKFWGDKAELRRFKDGSITESVVWSDESPVIHQILSYIIQRHWKTPPASVRSLGNRVEQVLGIKNLATSRQSSFRHIGNAFQNLSLQIRQLEGLPLSIRSILPTSSQLRYASLDTPVTSMHSKPVNIMIEFEGSTRWPDSLPAIQRTKIAFLIKLGDLLSASDSSVIAKVGLENADLPAAPFLNCAYLDIRTTSSLESFPTVFRLRIHHDRTQLLLRNLLPSVPTAQKPNLQSALQTNARESLASPLHTTTIERLCTVHHSLSHAIFLLKSWLASHNLTSQIPEEIIELFAARVYVQPCPYPFPPSASQTALLRALDVIARWDWSVEPMIIELNNGNNSGVSSNNNGINSHRSNGAPEEQDSFATRTHARFKAWRQTLDPALNNVVWFIATDIDETGVVWTQDARPPRVVAGRVRELAAASVKLIEGNTEELDGSLEMWRSIFTSPLTDFNFLIYLNSRHVMSGKNALQNAQFKNIQLQLVHNNAVGTTSTAGPSGGFDPTALFLQDLEKAFSPHTILFFHGHGKNIIAGLWNPKTLGQTQGTEQKNQKREWRVMMGYSSIPAEAETEPAQGEESGDITGEGSEDRVMTEGIINQKAILAEIEMLGGGLVDRIELMK